MSIRFILVFLITSLILTISFAAETENGVVVHKKTSTPALDGKYAYLNINRFATVFEWDGQSSKLPWASTAGGFYPRGSVSVIYKEGLVWGGLVNDATSPRKRVGGSTFISSTRPGWVVEGVQADWENDPAVRIYRIRKDLQTTSDTILREDVAEMLDMDSAAVTQDDVDSLRAMYQKDWDEWPVTHGAPFYDLNHNDIYESGQGETPGLLDADQVIWYAFNDFDSAHSQNFAGSPTMGLEIQVTIWGYSDDDIFGDVYYKRYRITNLSGVSIDSLYFGQWVDPDIGSALNDFVGTDTLNSVAYAYNGTWNDVLYDEAGLAPAAVAYQFVSGPVVSSPGDTAIFDFEKKPDFKNLPMTSFGYFGNNSPIADPDMFSYIATRQWYNLLRGYTPTDTEEPTTPYTNTVTGEVTKFPLAGDPVTQSGDVDGALFPPGDRRMVLATGPVDMLPGEVQELVIAVIGGISGDYMASFENLRNNYMAAANAHHNIIHRESETPVMSINGGGDASSFQLNWTDLKNRYSGDNYTFVGFDLFQINTVTGVKTKVANYDVIDDITTILDGGKVVYSGQENGDITEVIYTKNPITGNALEHGDKFRFGIVGYVYNPFAATGKRIISNVESMPTISVTIYPDDFFAEITPIHVSGIGSGSVIVQVVDPSKYEGDDYNITFDWNGDSSAIVLSLFNSTKDIFIEEDILMQEGLNNVLFPSEGFRLVITNSMGFYAWTWEGDRWISGFNWGGAQFFGGADIGAEFFGSTVDSADIPSIHMVFQDSAEIIANGWASQGAVYRRDLEYAHAGTGDLPFSAYDVSDTLNQRRLNICFVEDDNSATANSIWDMGWDGSLFPDDQGAREYLFIMSSDYNGGTDYDDSNWGPAADVYYQIWPKNRGSRAYLSGPFTLDFLSGPGMGIESEDIYKFNAVFSDIPDEAFAVPKKFTLSQNYPNPFNPTTTIAFDLPKTGLVELHIFNVLGQKVTTLIDENMLAGSHKVEWNATGKSSGMYFMRLRSGGKTAVRKMILIK